MEILWPALGISVIVVFVFFVLAKHWQRTLRHHSWTIRRLTERLRDLEEIGDPEFRRRLGQNLPSPLEQVLNFSIRLDQRFWSDTLHVSDEDMDYVQGFGTFLGSVKLERWRGRTVATVTEVLPESRAAGWQTRTLDFYSGDARNGNSLTLWELPLARPGEALERPPSLELRLRQDSLELRASPLNGAGAGKHSTEADVHELVFLRVPLDAARLAEFRSMDPLSSENDGSPNGNGWQSFYSYEDVNLGIEWQLRFRDLERNAEWEQWKILESAAMEPAADQEWPAPQGEFSEQLESGRTGSPAHTLNNPRTSRTTA